MGTYQVRVYASLGVGGFQQSYTIFSVQVIKDPCSYYPYTTTPVADLTLWVNQSNQVALIPPFTFVDPTWICNFTYTITDIFGNPLDPCFVVDSVALQGQGTNITLVTSDITKTQLSPVNVQVVGWPNRQNTTSM